MLQSRPGPSLHWKEKRGSRPCILSDTHSVSFLMTYTSHSPSPGPCPKLSQSSRSDMMPVWGLDKPKIGLGPSVCDSTHSLTWAVLPGTTRDLIFTRGSMEFHGHGEVRKGREWRPEGRCPEFGRATGSVAVGETLAGGVGKESFCSRSFRMPLRGRSRMAWWHLGHKSR